MVIEKYPDLSYEYRLTKLVKEPTGILSIEMKTPNFSLNIRVILLWASAE